jgi:hypothetical protein
VAVGVSSLFPLPEQWCHGMNDAKTGQILSPSTSSWMFEHVTTWVCGVDLLDDLDSYRTMKQFDQSLCSPISSCFTSISCPNTPIRRLISSLLFYYDTVLLPVALAHSIVLKKSTKFALHPALKNSGNPLSAGRHLV